MDLRMLSSRTHVSGCRSVLRAIRKGQAAGVFLAADAENHLIQPLRDACTQYGVPVTEVSTMTLLGQEAKLQVPAAAAAILK